MKRFGVGGGQIESINVANVRILLSQGGVIEAIDDHAPHSHASTLSSPTQERVFECTTCPRRFPSFQALGGHCASHKKPSAAGGHGEAFGSGADAKPRVHECSVCGLEFAIGQALGGHMRRHRAAATALPPPRCRRGVNRRAEDRREDAPQRQRRKGWDSDDGSEPAAAGQRSEAWDWTGDCR